MRKKYLSLTDPLYEYLCRCHSGTDDPVLRDLRHETESLGDAARMQISEEQGTFLTIFAAAIGAKSAIEVGTFTGYSSLCLARGLPEDGRLICIDASEQWTAIARRYWERAGVAAKIELRLGDAVPLLRQLEPGVAFDLAFVDADKTQYDAYYELLLPHIRPNGVILFDNMLWGGRPVEKNLSEDYIRVVDALNRKLVKDARVQTVLLPVADGIQICRKR